MVKCNMMKSVRKCLALMMSMLCMASLAGCANSTPNGSVSGDVSLNAVSQDNVNGKEEATTANQSQIDISDAKLINEGTLTVGMVIDYPPFEYYPDGSDAPIGVDVDIISAVSNKIGLKLEIKNVPWDDNLFTNIGKEYDVVCSAVTITDDRKAVMIFSDPYINNYQSIVINKNSSVDISNGFESLDGLKVAVQNDTVSAELMNSYIADGKINIELFENEVATDCFKQLSDGQVDAVVCDSTVAEGQVSRNSDAIVEAYTDESNVEQFAIAIGKDNPGLQKAINESLAILNEEGSLKKIIGGWFSR